MDDADEDGDGDAVRQTIPSERPPIQRNHLYPALHQDTQQFAKKKLSSYHSRSYSAAGGDRQDVEDCGSDDRADADVALRDEGADDVDEELWS